MSPKHIIGVSCGGLLIAVMLFLGAKSFTDVADPQNRFALLAQVSDTVKPKTKDSASQKEVVLGVVDTSVREQKTSLADEVEEDDEQTTPCLYESSKKATRSPVIFNEVAWMGSVENSSHEWIELKNVSAQSVDISGWQIIDAGEQIRITLPSRIRFIANGLFLLERGDDAVVGVSAHQEYTGALANTNEGVRLFDSRCNLIDEVIAKPNWPAGNSKERRTMERGDAMSWHTYGGGAVSGIFGTPLKENSLPSDEEDLVVEGDRDTNTQNEQPSQQEKAPEPTPQTEEPAPLGPTEPIYISEVMAGTTESSNNEFIELFNPNSSNVLLTGYSIKKKSSTGSYSSFVVDDAFEGVVIKAQDHLLLVHSGGYVGQVVSDREWPSSYSLAYTNNAVVLYDPEGVLVHEVSWQESIKDKSYVCTSLSSCSMQDVPTPENGQ